MAVTFPLPAVDLRPAEMMESAQHNLASWSRACTQVMHGLMVACIAQAEMTKSFYAMAPQDWARAVDLTNPRETARRWVERTKVQRDATVQDWRKIQDDLAATLFTAAESLLDSASPGLGGSDRKTRD